MALNWNVRKPVKSSESTFQRVAMGKVMTPAKIAASLGFALDEFNAIADYVTGYAYKADLKNPKVEYRGRYANGKVTLTTEEGWDRLVGEAMVTVKDYGREWDEEVPLLLGDAFGGMVEYWKVVVMGLYFIRTFKAGCLPAVFKEAVSGYRVNISWKDHKRQWQALGEGCSVDGDSWECGAVAVYLGKHKGGKSLGYGWYIDTDGRIIIRSNMKRLRRRIGENQSLYHTGYYGDRPSIRDLVERVEK